MTIKKSPGQTLSTVGLQLTAPVFSHRQLYVAASRASDFSAVHVLLPSKENGGASSRTKYNTRYSLCIVYHHDDRRAYFPQYLPDVHHK
ncbi:hypothetical protein DFQ27_003346 [Actinomortierella ambigua]|uniref:UvrD-like helicase C-terminal domain-containing protein n=1 Tax=Actinomortierella ambigua TaxID=1343610 RepID=A0A9P6Q9C4_9FUNG|nr:hypothetical protein DFQ27_003346 [Actinomortierella ambigua]